MTVKGTERLSQSWTQKELAPGWPQRCVLLKRWETEWAFDWALQCWWCWLWVCQRGYVTGSC